MSALGSVALKRAGHEGEQERGSRGGTWPKDERLDTAFTQIVVVDGKTVEWLFLPVAIASLSGTDDRC